MPERDRACWLAATIVFPPEALLPIGPGKG